MCELSLKDKKSFLSNIFLLCYNVINWMSKKRGKAYCKRLPWIINRTTTDCKLMMKAWQYL